MLCRMSNGPDIMDADWRRFEVAHCSKFRFLFSSERLRVSTLPPLVLILVYCDPLLLLAYIYFMSYLGKEMFRSRMKSVSGEH